MTADEMECLATREGGGALAQPSLAAAHSPLPRAPHTLKNCFSELY